jgi:hypothetical protein
LTTNESEKSEREDIKVISKMVVQRMKLSDLFPGTTAAADPTTITNSMHTDDTTMADGNHEQQQLRIGLILLVASWNYSHATFTDIQAQQFLQFLVSLLFSESQQWESFAAIVELEDDSLSFLIGEQSHPHVSLPPRPQAELPVLAWYMIDGNQTTKTIQPPSPKIQYLTMISSKDIIRSIQMHSTTTSRSIYDNIPMEYRALFNRKILAPLHKQMTILEETYNVPIIKVTADNNNNNDDFQKINTEDDATTMLSTNTSLRIFVAGDRSSVGKSSISLGILGTLLFKHHYPPSRLAYIKPATQSESTQLIQLFCECHGIPCVPVGPLVYYRGFTRAYLAGQTESSEHWLERCRDAVDRLSIRGSLDDDGDSHNHDASRIMIVDGVGFPAVGSICGTDNPRVAQASRCDGVILVGGSGVGAAVDGFNLNATYFDKYGVPVLGGIFNKLDPHPDAFYSLENCRREVTTYFEQDVDQITNNRRPFGFVPLFPRIAGPNAMHYVNEFIDLFDQHVDVKAIVAAAAAAAAARDRQSKEPITNNLTVPIDQRPLKRQKQEFKTVAITAMTAAEKIVRSRMEIEAAAISAGAAPSA